MEISNEAQARAVIEKWSTERVGVQQRQLKQAIESLELGQLYYENKGNDEAVTRLGQCIVLLRTRQASLEAG
ncbi:MAG: hypothetical protein A2521_14375 [Deltaproteobacteria bacterium RIFOXYD12_FULL_57_12]|nr:MAG: hypothetical protein A2521_14375 [Deltaproteobacteria bacterium RIFOXYD12_FULL_57_12]